MVFCGLILWCKWNWIIYARKKKETAVFFFWLPAMKLISTWFPHFLYVQAFSKSILFFLEAYLIETITTLSGSRDNFSRFVLGKVKERVGYNAASYYCIFFLTSIFLFWLALVFKKNVFLSAKNKWGVIAIIFLFFVFFLSLSLNSNRF